MPPRRAGRPFLTNSADLELEMLRELVLELIRANVISEGMVARVERQFEAEAHRHSGNSRAQRYEQLAHMARLLPIEAAGPSPSDFHAAQRRKRLHVITPDGGNNGT
jgi:hypothetical protein